MRGATARRQILLRRAARARDGDENPNVNILDATPLRSPCPVGVAKAGGGGKAMINDRWISGEEVRRAIRHATMAC